MKNFKQTLTTTSSPFNLPALRSLGVVGPALRSLNVVWPLNSLFFILYTLSFPSSIQAQEIDIRSQFNDLLPGFYGGQTLEDTGNTGSALGSVIGSIVGIAIPISAIAVLFYFLWAGFNWLTAGGDKQRVEDARNRMTNAVIGMTIVASALALSYIVNQFFGTNLSIEGASL